MLPDHALVLTAGLGTRLRPLTRLCAKPALPVAGQSIAERIIRSLVAQNVRDLVLNLHHLPETLTAIIGDGSQLGARVRYSWEQPVVLGSAGGPRHALGTVGTRTFVVVNGDTLTDVSLAAAAGRHAASGAMVTLALVPNTAPDHYGGVIVDAAGFVTGFVRRGPSAIGSYHFIGVQVVNADAVASLPDNQPARSIGGVYDALIRDRPGSVAAYLSNARFWDIGTPADYLATSLAFAAAEGSDGRCSGINVAIEPSAQVTDSVLWDDVTVGAGCRLTNCIVTSGVRLEPGSRYDRMIVMAHAGGVQTTPMGG